MFLVLPLTEMLPLYQHLYCYLQHKIAPFTDEGVQNNYNYHSLSVAWNFCVGHLGQFHMSDPARSTTLSRPLFSCYNIHNT